MTVAMRSMIMIMIVMMMMIVPVVRMFDPRRDGRLMKEWVVVPRTYTRRWAELAEIALVYVIGG